jgi:hypothetical protein
MDNRVQSRLQNIILELEQKYPFFKKMDIYTTVSNTYKKVHAFFKNDPDKEFEEIKKAADDDLKLSL